ncbi:MAG: hypothetical protein P0S93_05215 [Candidatus Neptunochlamydia sp.]|nr:hypothetical protein [Candidatus Neptunochlamydia sp.]
MWVIKGRYSRVVRQRGSSCILICFGAVCPSYDEGGRVGSSLCKLSDDGTALKTYILHQVTEGKDGIIVLDRAGWDMIPNLTLLPLSPAFHELISLVNMGHFITDATMEESQG